MEEAIIEDIKEYSSLLKLFTRRLKENARTVSVEHSLVSPVLLCRHLYLVHKLKPLVMF